MGNFTAPVPSFYIQDHLGNTRVTYEMDCGPLGARRNLEYVGDYLPYGGILREHIVDRRERFLTTEHERDDQTQLDYRGARYSDSRWGVFMSVDPLADAPANVGWSPYVYVWNNPMKYIDPDGRHGQTTIVGANKDGTYTVKDWKDDGSTDVILENGAKVGESLTTHSFVGDDGKAVVGAVINPDDISGQNFIDNEIVGENPGLAHYMKNATGGEKYDFKQRGSDGRPDGMTVSQYHYRGMTFDGKLASARDIGNYAAGHVAGSKGISWNASRLAFDALESYQKGGFAREGISSQKAQRAGHDAGYPIHQQKKLEREWQKMTNPWPIGPKY